MNGSNKKAACTFSNDKLRWRQDECKNIPKKKLDTKSRGSTTHNYYESDCKVWLEYVRLFWPALSHISFRRRDVVFQLHFTNWFTDTVDIVYAYEASACVRASYVCEMHLFTHTHTHTSGRCDKNDVCPV